LIGSVFESEAREESLIKQIGDEDVSVRQKAADALGKIGEPAKAAVPALIREKEVILWQVVPCATPRFPLVPAGVESAAQTL